MSDFPKKNYLVYIPNNFQVWYKALVVHASHDHDYAWEACTSKALYQTWKLLIFKKILKIQRYTATAIDIQFLPLFCEGNPIGVAFLSQ
jgi:hypothetical protein